MLSLKLFELEDITKDKFVEIFENYSKVVDAIPQLGVELLASTNEFNSLSDDLIYFEFQHDFKQPYVLRGKPFAYPRSIEAQIWIYFRQNKHYVFVSGEKDAISFIIPEIKRIIATEVYNDVSLEKIKISSEALVKISSEDATQINESWFTKLDESLQTVYLSGHLDDEEHNIHYIYQQVKEKAGDLTSINYTSRKLGYSISISRKKKSIHTKSRHGTPESLIYYFEEVIEKNL